MATNTSKNPSTDAAGTAPPRRKRRGCAATLTVLTLLVVLAGFGVWRWGPQYGVYLVPPSPAAYADQALRRMDEGYYAEGERWQQAREQAVRRTRDAASYADTLPALREALTVAGGPHSRLFEAGQSLGSADTDRPMPQVRTDAAITTVTVPKVTAEEQAVKDAYAAALANGIAGADRATTCGWIVDVRQNHGGDMHPMLAGLIPVLDQGRIGGWVDRAKHTTELEIADGKVRVGGRDAAATPTPYRSSKPVAVLQGPDTGSSGEIVVLAFKGSPRARSFGAPTAGYSSSNTGTRLYDGTQMLLTTAVDIDRTGAVYGGPVPPDQASDLASAEQAARTWLQGQCGR